MFVFRSPPEAQHEVQGVSLLQLEVTQLLVLAAQLLSTENDALLIRGDALVLPGGDGRWGGADSQISNAFWYCYVSGQLLRLQVDKKEPTEKAWNGPRLVLRANVDTNKRLQKIKVTSKHKLPCRFV